MNFSRIPVIYNLIPSLPPYTIIENGGNKTLTKNILRANPVYVGFYVILQILRKGQVYSELLLQLGQSLLLLRTEKSGLELSLARSLSVCLSGSLRSSQLFRALSRLWPEALFMDLLNHRNSFLCTSTFFYKPDAIRCVPNKVSYYLN